MDTTVVPIVFAFTDHAGARREVQLDYDLSAPEAATNLDVVAARLAEVYGLTEEQTNRVRLLVAGRVHQYSLMQLALHRVAVVRAPDVPPMRSAGDAGLADWPSRRAAAALVGANPRFPAQPGAALLFEAASGADLEAALRGDMGDGGAAGRGGRGRGGRSARGGRPSRGRRGDKRGKADGDDDDGGGGGGGKKRRGRPRSSDGADGEDDEAEGDDAEGEDDGNLDHCCKCLEEGDLLCCDRCPRSYHTDCLGLKDVPEGEWLCPECVTTFGAERQHEGSATSGPVATAYFDGPFKGRASTQASPEAELADIVAGLLANDFATPFAAPVDPSNKVYKAAVPRPQDLTTLQRRLAEGDEYGRGKDFNAARAVTDLRLVWHNCKVFNKPMTTIWRLADVLWRETETALRDRLRLTAQQAAELKALRVAELSGPNLHTGKPL